MPCLFYFWILAEIIVFILVGSWIGIGWTLLLIIATTIAGFALLRNQSFKVMQKMQEAMRTGRQQPFAGMEASMKLFAGMLLIIPGFISDSVGLICLIPGTRRWILKGFGKAGFKTQAEKPKQDDPGVIEGEFWEEDKTGKQAKDDESTH